MISATALVYPDKKVASVAPKSVKKRMKAKEFARSVNRDHILLCEQIGISLDDFISISLGAMCGISDRLGL
jgi:predicted hydrolase (HD superfamily)